MTSSSFDFMTSSSFGVSGQLKNGRFSKVLLNISKKVQLIFTKLMSFSGQLSIVSFDIKRLKTGHSVQPWQTIREGVLG